ncbi:hypothetical protein ES708_05175 [subsurface metagenome]
MTIEKAIEILKLHQEPTEWDLYDDDVDAIKLGIEALKRVYLQREHPKKHYNLLLSGETKE